MEDVHTARQIRADPKILPTVQALQHAERHSCLQRVFFPTNTRNLGGTMVISLAFYSILIKFICRDEKYHTNILTIYFLLPSLKILQMASTSIILHQEENNANGRTLPFNTHGIGKEK